MTRGVLTRVPPLARAGLAGLIVAALSLASPQLAVVAAALAWPVLARLAPPSHLAALAVALRALLPDVAAPMLPSWRDALATPLVALVPEPDAGVAIGSLLGGSADLPRELRDAFARTGTTHLLAASGFNITLAAGAVAAILRPLGPRAVALGTIGATAAFALVAGLGPSVARASVMSVVAATARLSGRAAFGPNALGASCLVLLLLSPRAVTDVGFLLSMSATAGLLLFATRIEARLRGPAWLRASLASTTAATAASLPVSAEAFGRISLVSPLANVAVAPLVAPLMTATALALTLGAVAPAVAAVPAWVAFALARTLRGIVESAATFPFASVSVAHGGALVLAGYGIAAAIAARRAIGIPRPPSLVAGPSRRAVAFALGALVAAGAAVTTVTLAASGSPRVVALDVGQGDAFLLDAGDALALVDGGPDPARTLRSLAAALPAFSSRLDVVALTHSHADHANGLAAVLDRYAVGLALEPVDLQANDVASAWHAALAAHDVPVRAVRRGDRVRAGSLVLDVLGPNGDPADPLPNLVLRATLGRLRVLLLGDASERAQQDLLLDPAQLRADVYAPPHHGAATPYADALVGAARPRVALISVGAGNRYGHPTPDTLRALGKVPTLRTDRDGTLEVSPDGEQLDCRIRAAALPRPWDRWLSRSPPCARPRARARVRRRAGRGSRHGPA